MKAITKDGVATMLYLTDIYIYIYIYNERMIPDSRILP